MNQRRELPTTWQRGPFRVADAIESGVPESRLRASDLLREYWGLRAPRMDALTLERRCALMMLRMPESAFVSHSTAALLHGIPLPPALAAENRLHISLPAPARAPHAREILGHALLIETHEVMRLDSGIAVTTPIRTWLDLGSRLPLLDLVAAGDYVINDQHPLATLEDLAASYRARKSRRGRRTLRESFSHLDPRSESPQESRLRTIIQIAGLPSPQVNSSFVTSSGRFLARCDLYLAEFRLVIEYQGDYHRDKTQWRKDMTRRSQLEATGRRVMEVNADDLRNPLELVGRIRKLAGLPYLKVDLR